MSEWTSVKEQFPGFGQVCDVKGHDIISEVEGVAVAYICPEYENLMWNTVGGEDYTPIVTDWKPRANGN